jgi:hypothetical protein
MEIFKERHHSKHIQNPKRVLPDHLHKCGLYLSKAMIGTQVFGSIVMQQLILTLTVNFQSHKITVAVAVKSTLADVRTLVSVSALYARIRAEACAYVIVLPSGDPP